jgi:hypothetical protein
MSDKPTKASLAAKYASWGWKVFPIAPGTKDRPLCKWGSEASDDPAIVARYWQRTPDANIGIAVGPSGLAVIDLDNKKGKNGSKVWADLEFDYGEAPATLMARTPTGGEHLYFKGTVGNTVDKLGEGVDTRGQGGMGGYVLAPGSVVAEGSYEWASTTKVQPLPAWVAERAAVKREDRVERDDVAVAELDTPAAVAWAKRHLERDARIAVSGSGGNYRAFTVACELRDKGISQGMIEQMFIEYYSPRCEPPWSNEECATFARNAWSYASVVGPGGDSAEAHFGGAEADDWGKAGEPPSIEEFKDQGARPLVPGGLSKGLLERNPHLTTPGGPSEYDDLPYLEQWVWIAQQNIFIRRSDKLQYNEKAFDGMYGFHGEKGRIVATLMSSPGMIQKFETFKFLPGEPEFAGPIYNMWIEPSIKPKAGDTTVFDDHLKRLLPDPVERGYALDWMAWVLQNEKLKPNFMFLMQGEQGSGKSWLGAVMARLVDKRNTMLLRTEDVGSKFNSWISRTRLAIVEELMGDDKRTLANRMKALVTQEDVPVELKGKDITTMPNKAAFMAFTNHLDAIKLENSDRRYMIFRSAASGKDDVAYFERLWAVLDDEAALAAIMHSLVLRQVARSWGLGRAPHTKAHEEMRREGMPEVEQWIIEEFEMSNPPFNCDILAVDDIVLAMPTRFTRVGGGIRKIVATFIRDELKAVKLGPHRIPGGSASKQLWSIRRHELVAQMAPKARVERYMKNLSAVPSQSAVEDFNDDVAGMADNLDDPLA